MSEHTISNGDSTQGTMIQSFNSSPRAYRVADSPSRSSKPSYQNRRTVVVEQTMVTAPNLTISPEPPRDSNPSENLRRKSSSGRTPTKDETSMLSVDRPRRFSTDSNSHPLLSPPDSVRSSCSSLVETASSISSVVIIPSSEDRILDELKRQISYSATKINQLEEEVQVIPKLKGRIDELEKERGKLSNDILDNQEIVQSMKQRVTMLHEQNSQLAKVTQASKSGGSSEILRIRNALVASLAQLKQFGEQVQAIPALKSQLRSLTEENTRLADAASRLPKGVKPSDYQKLCDENKDLKETTEKLIGETKEVRDVLSSVTSSTDELRRKMEAYENSKTFKIPLQERIKRLEKEKDGLYQEIIDLKFQQRATLDIDTAHLSKEVAELHKSNSQLRSKIEQMKIESKKQKEQFVVKLFELEALNIRTQKYEVEKRLLDIEQAHVESEQRRSANPSPELLELFADSSADESMIGAPPESKIQFLKLQQLRVHGQQSRNLMQTLLLEKDELEKTVNDLNARLEEDAVSNLESKYSEAESKLLLAREKIVSLEIELESAVHSDSRYQALSSENKALQSQLSQLETAQKHITKLAEAQKQVEEHRKEHDMLVRSLKKAQEDKRKGDKRYKESRERLRTLARELGGSVELLKNYQSRCAELQAELDRSKEEMQSLRSSSATMKAQLELTQMEKDSNASHETKDSTPQQMPLNEELLQQKIAEASAELKGQISQLEEERNRLKSELENLSKAFAELSETKVSLEKQIATQLTEMKSLMEEKSTISAEKQKIDEQLQTKSDECTSLKSKVSEVKTQLEQSQQWERKAAESLKVVQFDLDKAEEELEKIVSERQSLVVKVDSLTKQVSTYEGTSSERDRELSRLKAELVNSQKSFEEYQMKIDENVQRYDLECVARETAEKALRDVKEGDMSALSSQVNSIAKERDELTEKLTRHEDKIVELERALKAKETETESLQKTAKLASESQTLLASSHQSVKDLQKRLDELNVRHTKLESSYKAAQESLQVRAIELETQREETCRLAKAIKDKESSAQSELSSARKEIETLRTKMDTTDSASAVVQLETRLQAQSQELLKVGKDHQKYKQEAEQYSVQSQKLADEAEGYKAMIKSLQRQLDEAETREIEHEQLRHKIKLLEKSLGDSSHDNKALLTMLHETVKELPGMSNESNRLLQDENHKLEEQVSILSQWNDKQRREIEDLEMRVDQLDGEKHELLMDIMAKDNCAQENIQLKRELKEVEMEVNTLRRQVRADIQEELHVKVETQTQLLTMFNQHNTLLQGQVENLQTQVRGLGGALERDKPVSPPPMPDIALALPSGEEMRQRSMSDLGRENTILKQRIFAMEGEMSKLHGISATVRRRSSALRAITSVPVGVINEELQVK